MRKSEKELKQAFENIKNENIKLEQRISMTTWKMRQPQNIKEAEKIKGKYKKILEILESE